MHHVSVGNTDNDPSYERPDLALLAMRVIAAWSLLESDFEGVFVQMLGANPRPAAAIYASLTSAATQKAALRAIAEFEIPMPERDVLDALFSQLATVAKDRNKVAHWIWGSSPDLPDGVLLTDPKAMIKYRVATEDYDRTMRDKPDWTLTRPEFPRDETFVFYAHDFENMVERIQHLSELVTNFRFVLIRDHPVNAGGQLFDRLSNEPGIRAFVDRRLLHRKIDEATPEQSPSPTPTT